MKFSLKGIFDCPKPGSIRYRTWWAILPTWCYLRGTKYKLGRWEFLWLQRVYARQMACQHYFPTGAPTDNYEPNCVSWDNDAFLTKEEYEREVALDKRWEKYP